MKIPERIVGVLELKDSEFSFELNKDTYELRLYSTTENDAFELLFDGVHSRSSNIKEHKWIDKITIKGRTSEGYLIYFGTTDNPSSYNGYRTYDVTWYYVTNDDKNKIDEIQFFGREINYFYNPARAFNKTISYKENDNTHIESMSVQTIDNEDMFCGQFSSGDVKIDVSCSAYAIMHFHAETPFDSASLLRLKFSNSIGVDEIVNHAICVQNLLRYLCYRTNISFSDISTFISTEEGKVRNCGKLVFKKNQYEELNESAKKRVIKADYLKNHVADLLGIIEADEMPFGHFCSSIEDMAHYPISRIIMILAAFESEFRNVYGQGVIRSEEYMKTKEEVVELIEKHAESLSGKQRRYVNSFAKVISNRDSSYGDNLLHAFKDCKIIFEPFVNKRFNGSYDEIIDTVSVSINELRNGLAHSRLDMKFEARHLTEIKLVEELLYVIRLKKLGVEDTIIQKTINELFQEHFAI